MNRSLDRPVVAFVSQARGVTYLQRVEGAAHACDALGFDTVCLPPVPIDEPLPLASLRSALAGRHLHALVCHRVVDSAELAWALDWCRRRGAAAIYDVDDFIFGDDFARLFAELGRGSDEELRSLVGRAQRAIGRFDRAWAATPMLVDGLRALDVDRVALVRNTFSARQRAVAMRTTTRSGHDEVVIGFGSGSGTHGADLAMIAEPLAVVLDTIPEARFHFIGREELPRSLRSRSDQVVQTAPVPYHELPSAMANWHISLAPIVARPFCEAKSELKFIDASLVGVPTVASPSQVMQAAIDPGRTGLLAGSANQWQHVLTDLARDRVQRTLLGARARREVLERYGPEARQHSTAVGLDRQLVGSR